MLLRTSIPWIHRWNIFGMKWLCWQGIYLNGLEATRDQTFDRWLTNQLFGLSAAAGSEIRRNLYEWRQSQWFRLYMEIIRMPILRPRPVYIFVDRFEELMKCYPEEAIPWADMVTNYHTRNNLARVIFVVNSEVAAQSLLNLDGHRRRFEKVAVPGKNNPLCSSELKRVPALAVHSSRCGPRSKPRLPAVVT